MVWKIRFFIQNTLFILLMYGGRFGVQLGHSLPCFACPYVGGCAGHCYLMALQNHMGFGLAFPDFFTKWGLDALFAFLFFLLLFVPLSKMWCGWVCPFGTLQDWFTSIRRKMGIRESRFTWAARGRLKIIKYILLAALIIIPVSIANFGLHRDFALPFCQICPAKPVLPLFVGETKYFSLDFTNSITLSFTVLSLIITGGIMVGIFFKDRFFCIFCPLLALMHIFKKIGFVRFEKSIDTCLGCGNCQRMCPVDIKEVYLEKKSKDVMKDDCMLCMKCAESCPGDDVLQIKFLGYRIFSSSKKYLAQKWGRLYGKK
jgi:ferredoxin-type protein NapH